MFRWEKCCRQGLVALVASSVLGCASPLFDEKGKPYLAFDAEDRDINVFDPRYKSMGGVTSVEGTIWCWYKWFGVRVLLKHQKRDGSDERVLMIDEWCKKRFNYVYRCSSQDELLMIGGEDETHDEEKIFLARQHMEDFTHIFDLWSYVKRAEVLTAEKNK
ncbi:MAG TPA: hypothetical protein VJB87_05205 [Candidatus Nanoarchaeia archaeon]|nr:hypothetical protein [Candidatus Nanoarchaeia archaeon]